MDTELAYTGYVVVFDLDDTLYHELDYLKSGFQAVAQYVVSQKGGSVGDLYDVMLATYNSGRNAFDMLAQEYMDSESDFVVKAVEIYRTHIPQIQSAPGVNELLQSLADKGVRMALITDGRSCTQRNKLSALGIEKFFPPENVIISEEIGTDKLSLKGWQTIVRRYPNATRFIYVGDNPAKDFLIPNRLGWITIGLLDKGENIHIQSIIPTPEYSPQYWVNSIVEINETISRALN